MTSSACLRQVTLSNRPNLMVSFSPGPLRISIAALFWVCGFITATASAQAVLPRSSDSFVESIGINVHFLYDGTGKYASPYFQKFDTVAARLDELGVRYVRDAIWPPYQSFDRPKGYPNRDYKWKPSYAVELHKRTGIRLLGLVSEKADGRLIMDPAVTQDFINIVAKTMPEVIWGFEGPNEYDHPSQHAADPNWQQNIYDYQGYLYRAVKSHPALANHPVIAPSFINTPRAFLAKRGGWTGKADYANMHPYPGGMQPTRSLEHNFANHIWPSGLESVVVTETGYHNALGDSRRDVLGENAYISHPGIPEDIEARYLPRLLATYFGRGILKTFVYELADVWPSPENNDETRAFGILRNDLSRKPAFHALRRLIDLTEDPGPPHPTEPLAYTLSGKTENTKDVLLQKRDGSYLLLLWQEVPSYLPPDDWRSGGEGTRLYPAPAEMVLSLPAPADVQVYAPSVSASPVASFTRTDRAALSVSDHLLVVEVRPLSGGGGQSKKRLFDIHLDAGWNLVSLPSEPVDADLDVLFAGIADLLVEDKSGREYKPGDSGNTLNTWDSGQAYRVWSKKAVDVAVALQAGKKPGATLELEQGWNLIPYHPSMTMPIKKALGTASSHIFMVKDEAGRVYCPAHGIADLLRMSPGEGYLVYATDRVRFSYPDDTF